MGIFDFFRRNDNDEDEYEEDYDEDDYSEMLSEDEAADIFASYGEDEDYDFGYDHDDLRSHYIEDEDYDDNESEVIDWYCDECGEFMYTQYGDEDYRGTSICPNCGELNDTSENNLR